MDWKVIFLVLSFCGSAAIGQRQNVSLVEPSKCKSYNCFGYGYKSFFKVEDIHHMRNDSDLIHTRVAIPAGQYALILLSETNNPTRSDDVIEIFLEAGSITHCEIRRRIGFNPIKSRRVLQVLNSQKPMFFVIRVTNSGFVEVKYEGETEPLFSGEYGTHTPKLHFIAFSCWFFSHCKLFYDCPNPLYDTLTEANENIPPQVALERDLLTEYDVQTPPFELQSVSLGMNIFEVQYDMMRGVLKTRVQFWYEWSDPKLLWQPENYQDLSQINIHYDEHKTWVPVLKFPDGVSTISSDSSSYPLKITVHHNSTVQAVSKRYALETWCPLDMSIKSWPHEKVLCNISISLTNADANLSRYPAHIPRVEQPKNSPWNINEIDMTMHGGVTFSITLTRSQAVIDYLFGSPLSLALVMLASSVLVHQSMYRMFLISMAALVLVLTMITLSKHVPNNYNPIIVQYYCGAIGFLALALVCHLISQHFVKYPPTKTPPRWMISCYNSKIFSVQTDNIPELSFSEPAECWKIPSLLIDGLFLLCITIYFIYIIVMGY